MEQVVYCFGLICFMILLTIFADEIDKRLNKLLEPKEKARQKQLAELRDTLKKLDESQKDIDKQLEELYNMLQKER